MSIAKFVGDLDLKIAIPGEFHVNDRIVADQVTAHYAKDRLRLTFTPVDPSGTRGEPITSINQITYVKGTIGLIGLDIGSSTNYVASYHIIGKRLTINTMGRTTERRIKNLVEAIGVIIGVILSSSNATGSITKINRK